MSRILTGLGRIAPRNFNDLLALLLACGVIPGLWIIHTQVAAFPELVLGSTVPVWTTIAHFYFRKSRGKE